MARRERQRQAGRTARTPTPAQRLGRAQQLAKVQPFGAQAGLFLRRHWRWVLILLVLSHSALALLVFLPAPHTGGDNAGYLTLARSLLENGSYRDLYDPAEPPHTQYPPVFPGILALALGLGLQPWVQLKLVIIAFSAAAVAFTYLWIRRRRRPELAVGVAAIVAFSPGVLDLSHWVLSDVPFWALTMIALWAWERLRPHKRGRFAIAIAATTLAYFTRSAGLPLIFAAVAWLVWRKRWQQLLILLAAIAPLAFLWWWRARTQGGVDYVGQFWWLDPYNPAAGRIGVGDLFERMTENGRKYITWHLPVLLFGVQRFLLLSIAIVLLALYGWARRMRRPSVADLFLPLYIGLIFIWPAVWSGERFLLPALPLILYYAADASVRIARALAPRAVRLVPSLAAAVLVLFALPTLAQAIRMGTQCTALYRAGDKYACMPDPWRDFMAIAEVAPRVLPDDAVVFSRKARTFYIASGLQGRSYPLSQDPAAFFQEARTVGARFVVFDGMDGLTQMYVAPVLVSRPNAFCILFGLGQGRAVAFGFNPDAPISASPSDPVTFEMCGTEYWRNAAARDSLYQGLLPLP